MRNDLKKIEKVALGGGCFWCTEAIYKMLKGVTLVLPGYAGGIKAHPTYEEVCSGTTGHAEVILIEYNPDIISFSDLLTVFFATHDPTTPNRQGADVGTQYRSIILYTTESQKQEAENFIHDLETSHPGGAPIVTEVKPLETFYAAEEYHRDYYNNNPQETYCRLVINPKIKKVQQEFYKLLKDNEK
jgi:peptide-methionine (S)-S-oxide reductase